MRAMLLAIAVTFAGVGSSRAQELAIFPGDLRLTGPHASQRVIVVQSLQGTRDRQVEATLSVADSNVAKLESDQVLPVGDGETTLTAEFEGRKATAKVRVEKAKEEQ